MLEAALPLLGRDRLNVRIEDISAASGVSIGSIYHHFGSRDGVISAVYGRQLSRLVQELADATTAHSDLREGVTSFITTYIDWIVTHPDSASLIYGVSPLEASPEVLSVAARSKSSAITALTQWFQTFVEAGKVQISDPGIVELILLGPVREYCQRLLAGVMSEPPEIVGPELAEAACRAIAA